MNIKKSVIAVMGCALFCSAGLHSQAFAAEKETSVISNFHTSQTRIQLNQYGMEGEEWMEHKAILP